MFADDGARRIMVIAQGAHCQVPNVEILALPTVDGHMAPAAIIAGLAEIGLRRVLVEAAEKIPDEAKDWDGERKVSWTLVKSQMLRALDGSYSLAPAGRGGTEVTYQLAVDVKIPMLGMIKRKAEKVIIDRALAGLKKRVESST